MKKNIIFIIAFFIVWVFTAFMCYLLNLVLGRNLFTGDWHEYIVIGFAGAMAGVFGPILAAWLGKLFNTKS